MNAARQNGASKPRTEFRGHTSPSSISERTDSAVGTRAMGWGQVLRASVQYLLRNGSILAHHEVQYAEQQLATMAVHYRKAALLTAAAAGLVVCGIVLFLFALVFMLATRFETWLACLLVGTLAWMLGFVCYGIAKNTILADFQPTAAFLSSLHTTKTEKSVHTPRV